LSARAAPAKLPVLATVCSMASASGVSTSLALGIVTAPLIKKFE
jgi:hypothetical protein